jgi:two-component system torCAD operon response regulator TorR
MTKLSVLVVDDQEDILDLLDSALSAEGYRVVKTTSVREFWDAHAGMSAALFIVDLTLPDGNGFGIIRALRRQTDRGIIILSGRGDEADHVLGLELGADDYVTKPFRIRELTARVNAVVRRSAQAAAGPQNAAPALPPTAKAPAPQIDVEFDGYRLSYGGRQLWAPDGTEIELTTSEFDLLAALTQRRGQVLNRDQIMNGIKGRDWESYDRVVDGIVSRLRRKMPVVGRKSHYIRTVHGVGYSFSA